MLFFLIGFSRSEKMIITLNELKRYLIVSRDIVLKEYIAGSSWTKEAIGQAIYDYETGGKTDKNTTLLISHINDFFGRHNLFVNFYSQYIQALTYNDQSMKVYIPANAQPIIEYLKKEEKNL